MPQRPYRRSNSTEQELSKRLFISIIGIVSLMIFAVLSLFLFAPKIGFIFGLFSVHRNDPIVAPAVKVTRPVFSDLPGSTSSQSIDIHGYATPKTTVKVYVNGPEAGQAKVNDDGTFSFTDIALIEGSNTIFAKAVDDKGEESERTDAFTIMVDKKGPKFVELSPKDGDTVKNLDKRILITGKLDKKATIKINDRIAIQKPDLTFEFLMGVSEGDVKIKIEAVDEAGNKTEKNYTVKYQRESY